MYPTGTMWYPLRSLCVEEVSVGFLIKCRRTDLERSALTYSINHDRWGNLHPNTVYGIPLIPDVLHWHLTHYILYYKMWFK